MIEDFAPEAAHAVAIRTRGSGRVPGYYSIKLDREALARDAHRTGSRRDHRDPATKRRYRQETLLAGDHAP
jgi:hypothetical protein